MSTRDIDGQMVLPLIETDLFATLAKRITPDWHHQAVCAGTPVNTFYPDPRAHSEDGAAAAVEMCNGCRVRSSCRAVALLRDELGVWGGTTEYDRDQMRTALSSGTSVDAVLVETIRPSTDEGTAA